MRLPSDELRAVVDDLPATDVNHATIEIARLAREALENDALPIEARGTEDLTSPHGPSRALPVAAGMGSALLVIAAALWFTGAIDQVRNLLDEGKRNVAISADAGGAGSVSVITEPSFSDAGVVVLGDDDVLDAGVADAGEEEALALAAVDAGLVDEVILPEGADDAGPGTPRSPKRRTVAVLAPGSVQWQGTSGEVYGAGRGTLRLPESVRAIYAIDLRRGSKTRIAIDSRTRTIDWNKLPRGKLSVRVRPYADVFLGKEKLGTTPLAPVSVVAGTYEVTLVYKKITKVVPFEVKANKPATLNVVMTK